jgi:hypothetical protein
MVSNSKDLNALCIPTTLRREDILLILVIFERQKMKNVPINGEGTTMQQIILRYLMFLLN